MNADRSAFAKQPNERNIRGKLDELHNGRLACDGRNSGLLRRTRIADGKKKSARHLKTRRLDDLKKVVHAGYTRVYAEGISHHEDGNGRHAKVGHEIVCDQRLQRHFLSCGRHALMSTPQGDHHGDVWDGEGCPAPTTPAPSGQNRRGMAGLPPYEREGGDFSRRRLGSPLVPPDPAACTFSLVGSSRSAHAGPGAARDLPGPAPREDYGRRRGPAPPDRTAAEMNEAPAVRASVGSNTGTSARRTLVHMFALRRTRRGGSLACRAGLSRRSLDKHGSLATRRRFYAKVGCAKEGQTGITSGSNRPMYGRTVAGQ